MTPSNGIVEIRTLAELLSLYEIASDSTLTKDQYRNPLRPYRLIQPEASCQYQKNGKRCSQMHQHGFVVERHDDSKVLIGNCCALNHLGLDDEQVRGELKNHSRTADQAMRTGSQASRALCRLRPPPGAATVNLIRSGVAGTRLQRSACRDS
ncbi:hypothetical protein [Pseudomonas aeruginosa]|uniref:hypothetical protein n=1 Tax=Pseudomonas aeruginosa TaxID=287 RepID=UPI003CFC0FB4